MALLIPILLTIMILLLMYWALHALASAVGAPPVVNAVIDILLVLINATTGLGGSWPVRLR